jgi:predicted dehydrogenase
MTTMTRRDFLWDSAALTAVLGSAGLFGGSARAAKKAAAQGAKKGDANDTLSVAVIGVRGRGQSHVSGFANRHGCVVTTICDADEAVIGSSMKTAEKQQGKAPRFVQDLRRVMEDPSIDIVSIATPNHWHALAAIWALQAGKHVYVEKPVSHNVSEGRRIVEVARKAERICQTGTQSRSSAGMRSAMEFLHGGKLGKVTLARGLCYKLRGSIGKVSGPQALPPKLDYDLWCGPAPVKPLMRKNLHYDWHWIWDYGNGDLGNQGIHEMDKARWGLGKNTLAKSVVSVGGRFGYVDDGETANTQICLFDYGDCELIFEVRGLASASPYPGKDYGKRPQKPHNFVGNIWYGTEGYLVSGDYYGAAAFTPKGELIQKFGGGGDHFANFVKAVRSGNAGDLNADILEGHLSSALCHLGNISYRLGTEQSFDKSAKIFGTDKEAAETLTRMEDHLKENKLPMEKTTLRVGRKLELDPKTETFIDDKDANLQLTRIYRKGFEVPAKA